MRLAPQGFFGQFERSLILNVLLDDAVLQLQAGFFEQHQHHQPILGGLSIFGVEMLQTFDQTMMRVVIRLMRAGMQPLHHTFARRKRRCINRFSAPRDHVQHIK